MSETSKPKPSSPDAADDRPWWRYGMVWLVIGGPLVVVIAALVTVVIAVRGADPVLDTRLDTPAVQGRNHAATPPAKP